MARALIHEETVNLTRVDVQTKEGTIYLSGQVQNDAQKQRAEQIARTVQGVQHVINKLELQPSRAGGPRPFRPAGLITAAFICLSIQLGLSTVTDAEVLSPDQGWQYGAYLDVGYGLNPIFRTIINGEVNRPPHAPTKSRRTWD